MDSLIHFSLYNDDNSFIQDIYVRGSGIDNNKINQSIGYLESYGLIMENDPGRYIITTFGIDTYEQTIPLEIQTAKKHERTKVLLILAELYKINTNEFMHSEILLEKMQLN